MNRLTLLLLAVLLLLLPGAAPTALGLSRSAEASYQLALGVASNVAPDCAAQGPVVNGACFLLYPKESSVAFAVQDGSGRQIAVEYQFMDGNGAPITTGHFCNSSAMLTVPKGARSVVLLLGEPGKLDGKPLPGCQLQRGVGGVVNAIFR